MEILDAVGSREPRTFRTDQLNNRPGPSRVDLTELALADILEK